MHVFQQSVSLFKNVLSFIRITSRNQSTGLLFCTSSRSSFASKSHFQQFDVQLSARFQLSRNLKTQAYGTDLDLSKILCRAKEKYSNKAWLPSGQDMDNQRQKRGPRNREQLSKTVEIKLTRVELSCLYVDKSATFGNVLKVVNQIVSLLLKIPIYLYFTYKSLNLNGEKSCGPKIFTAVKMYFRIYICM